MRKALIEEAVRTLLNSANTRGTQQGVLVYTKVLEMLAAATREEQVNEITQMLNSSLTGIEAHGSFTAEEFVIVRKLREL